MCRRNYIFGKKWNKITTKYCGSQILRSELACHPCARATLVFSVSFRFLYVTANTFSHMKGQRRCEIISEQRATLYTQTQEFKPVVKKFNRTKTTVEQKKKSTA
ncbi:hypothetical protein AG1IA_09905 [Rhizoctonia solani AG-1 IA]|uniref:Uncharacterized protein n=1 Tax=Thanatephorus cucumeris (strain AG1-IA) TaxID=983506 RepID=L8WI68_THACA|nr:hypothetical protein AG1IA_09905 [Rhizoctonia solani AG-1 IA]